MEECIKIIVLGEPVTQLRPIFNSHTRTASDPKKSRDYKLKVRQTAENYLGKDFELINEAISVELMFYKSVPKSYSKKNTAMAIKGDLKPTVKPDIDNYIKCVLDGLTKVVWTDDNLIVDITAKKRYAEVPRAEIIIKKV